MTRSTIIDIEGRIHARTERAVLFSTDGKRDSAVWLPLSQCEVETKPGGLAVVTMEEWMGVEKGLV